MLTVSAPGLAALQRGFKEAPDYTRQELLVAMTTATALLEREFKDAFPSVSGLTRASIHGDAFSTPTGALGVVGSASVAVAAVELGTKPHMPPVEALESWVHDRMGLAGKEALGVAWAIARKIAKRGTKAQYPIRDSWDAQYKSVAQMFEQAAGRIAAHLIATGNGGAA